MYARNFQAMRVELLGRGDENALGLRLHLVAQFLGGVGDQCGMAVADVAVGKCPRCLGQRIQPSRHLNLVRGSPRCQVALPSQPGLGAQSHSVGVTLPAVEATEAAQELRLNPTDDSLQSYLVIGHGRRRDDGEVFCREPIQQRIDLIEDLSRGPSPPLPSHRTHVRIVSNICSVSSKFHAKIALAVISTPETLCASGPHPNTLFPALTSL